jgi:hypothetical protein
MSAAEITHTVVERNSELVIESRLPVPDGSGNEFACSTPFSLSHPLKFNAGEPLPDVSHPTARLTAIYRQIIENHTGSIKRGLAAFEAQSA